VPVVGFYCAYGYDHEAMTLRAAGPCGGS
jgi:hypothetical protein